MSMRLSSSNVGNGLENCAPGGCQSNWHYNKGKHMESILTFRQRVSGPDHHRWWNVGCTHYPRSQRIGVTVDVLARRNSSTLSARKMTCTVNVGMGKKYRNCYFGTVPRSELFQNWTDSWNTLFRNNSCSVEWYSILFANITARVAR